MKHICVMSLIGFLAVGASSSVTNAADIAATQQWLVCAVAESERIVDTGPGVTAWWRIAALAAEVGNDALCEKAIANAQRKIPPEAAAQMISKVFGLRLMVLAKAAAGKMDEVRNLVPPPPRIPPIDSLAKAGRLALVQAYARRGEFDKAMNEANAAQGAGSTPYRMIAMEQAKKGDKAAAVETARLIIKAGSNPEICQDVAVALVKHANADEEARIVATLYEPYRDVMLAQVATAQAECGRLTEAEKTIEHINEEVRKDPAKEALAGALVRSGKVDEARTVAAGMANPGSWRTRDLLVRAAMESGNWDAAMAFAREASVAGNPALVVQVERTRAAGRLTALSQMIGKAEDVVDPYDRFWAFSQVAMAHIAAKRETELRAWIATLKQPSDRAAAFIGAAMATAGLELKDVTGPELMMRWK